MNRVASLCMVGWAAGLLTAGSAWAYDPYVVPPAPVTPSPGPGLPSPAQVTGKEISFVPDQDAGVGFLVPNPESVLGWDGQAPVPGLIQGFDFSGSRFAANDSVNRQVDALASPIDALFNPLLANQSHLVYSISATSAASSVAPALITPIHPDALPEDIEYELAGGAPVHGKWAVHRTDINSDTTDAAFDVDALELWGGETPTPSPGAGDGTSYSHEFDAATGISVWQYDQFTHTSTPYITQPTIVTAVTSLLGSLPTFIPNSQIDLDALMSFDVNFPITAFDANAVGIPDQIIFSIRQITDPGAGDGSGFYATGSELFVFDGNGVVSFLDHAGHLWDKAWALTHLVKFDVEGAPHQLDIDALEAASAVPEPASIALLALAGLTVARRRR